MGGFRHCQKSTFRYPVIWGILFLACGAAVWRPDLQLYIQVWELWLRRANGWLEPAPGVNPA